MSIRYNIYTLDYNNTQSISNNYSQDNLKLATYTRENFNFTTCAKSKNPPSRQTYL